MLLLVVYLLLALCVSFFCSLLEAVLVSTPLSHVETLKNDIRDAISKGEYGRKERRRLCSVLIFENAKNHIDKSLSALLSLNTVAHTVGAAGAGVQSAKVFGDTYVGIIVAVLSFLILVLSEILPQSIGLRYWRKLCLPTGRIIRLLGWICYPFILLSEGISWLICRGKKDPGVSREEVSAIVSRGSKEGIFEKEEIQSLRSLLKLPDLRVRDIMTPRIVAVTASEEMTLGEFYRERNYLKFSRIPIHEKENPDEITGFVLLKNVFEELAADHFNRQLKELKRPILVATESQKVLNLWNRMQQPPSEDAKASSGMAPLRRKREQIAMVVDEYGCFVGLVTVEDMVETMLGMEIIDEKDTIADMQEYARRKWASTKADKKINTV